MRFAVAAVVALSGVGLANEVRAADIYSPVTPTVEQIETEDGWTFSVAPYFWAAGLSGDVASFGLPTIDVDASFSDILDNLDFAAMAIGEARNGRYSFFGDVIYTKIENSNATPRGILASTVDVTAETFAGLLGAGYAIADGPSGRLELIGGVKIWSAETKISFNGGFLDGIARSDSATWVDGVAGLRGTYAINSNFYLTGWGYVGAGGADIDWDVAGALGYRFNDTVATVVGYRALGVDYNDDGYVFDVVQQGPILGLVIRF